MNAKLCDAPVPQTLEDLSSMFCASAQHFLVVLKYVSESQSTPLALFLSLSLPPYLPISLPPYLPTYLPSFLSQSLHHRFFPQLRLSKVHITLREPVSLLCGKVSWAGASLCLLHMAIGCPCSHRHSYTSESVWPLWSLC